MQPAQEKFPECVIAELGLHRLGEFVAGRTSILADAEEKIKGYDHEVSNCLLQWVIRSAFVFEDIGQNFYREGNLRLGGRMCCTVPW
jgi:hypothetical protein